MSDGIDRKRIRRHLLIFSLAAPLMAIFTYVLLKSVCLKNLLFQKKPNFIFFSELMIHIPLILLVLRCYLVRAHFFSLQQYMFYLKFNLIMKIDNFVRSNLLFLLLDVVFRLFFPWDTSINNKKRNFISPSSTHVNVLLFFFCLILFIVVQRK